MAGSILKFRLFGQKKLSQRFSEISKKIKKLSAPMKVAAIIGYRDVMRHFQAEEGPTGRWKPLKYRKGKILQDTGRLRQSISFRSDMTSAKIGTNLIYAATHQFGRGAIPKRPFLWLSPAARENITKRVFKYVTN